MSISALVQDHQCCKYVNVSAWFLYLKLFEENLGERLPEVRRAEDGLDDDDSSVARIHQQVPDWNKRSKSIGLMRFETQKKQYTLYK